MSPETNARIDALYPVTKITMKREMKHGFVNYRLFLNIQFEFALVNQV